MLSDISSDSTNSYEQFNMIQETQHRVVFYLDS